LEFGTAANVGADGDVLTDRLLAAVAAAAKHRFGVSLAVGADAVTELDSSTVAKFSRHLVVRLPGAAFASAWDAGAFVATLLAWAGDAFMVRKVRRRIHLPAVTCCKPLRSPRQAVAPHPASTRTG